MILWDELSPSNSSARTIRLGDEIDIAAPPAPRGNVCEFKRKKKSH